MVLAAPRNGAELLGLLESAIAWNEGPFAIRYPRDQVPEEEFPVSPGPIAVGSWETLRPLARCNLLAVGAMVPVALEAAGLLERAGLRAGVVNCRFVRPMDETVLRSLTVPDARIVTIEENVLAGGFGSRVAQWFDRHPELQRPAIESFGLPDAYVEHGGRGRLLEICGLTASAIAAAVLDAARGNGASGHERALPARAVGPRGERS
jgi:1-deoxy-D-xylulose-5-phosphate synthase